MTIASETNRSGPYACNGATTSFPYASGYRMTLILNVPLTAG